MVGMWAGGVELGFDTIPTSPSFSCARLDPGTATTMEGLHRGLDDVAGLEPVGEV